MTEKRKYIEHFQCLEEIKQALGTMKRYIKRLEKEVAEHERLCKANKETVFIEYEALNKRASVAVLNGNRLLGEQDLAVLDKLRSAEVPDEQMCRLLRTSLSSVPELNSIALRKCQLEHVHQALDALVNCKLVCGIPDMNAVPVTQAPPVEVLKIDCGRTQDIRNPWRLCGTLEGDVIVCEREGGPVYKVYKNGTKIRLLYNGIAACVEGGDVYVISTDGGTVTQIKLNGSSVNHRIKPKISKPRGLAVSGDSVFILTSNAITKQSLRYPDFRETLIIEGCKDLSKLLKISDGGMTKLVFTTYDKHEVIICDEAGSVLTRFGGRGSEDGLYYFPSGISRMSNGHLLVADWGNHRIEEYKMDGTFVRNLLTKSDEFYYPEDIVYKYPYMWVVENDGSGGKIQLFMFTN